MPFAVLKSIREVSSEDKIHRAENLLRNDSVKKWITEEPGKKSAYVVIEMDKAYKIKGIDIGNECSAFVEVFVGGPSCTPENFKEILLTCSFMTPVESKSLSNVNRVRCFNREALVNETLEDKWTLLKIKCSQPFNTSVNYGLSFIKIHVEESSNKKNSIESSGSSEVNRLKLSCGGFVLREDSPDSESESTTALFSRWKQAKHNEGASAVLRTPSPTSVTRKPNQSFNRKKPSFTPQTENSVSKEKANIPDRNRNSLLFTDEDDEGPKQEHRRKKLEKLEKVIMADQERVTKEADKAKKAKKGDKSSEKGNKSVKTDSKAKKSPIDQTSLASTSHRRPSSSPHQSEGAKKPKLDRPVCYKPFHQLLNGVVLVISGIQNPDRADLRNKALSLGAKYKGDWESSSTHLICAFKNTPKYNQVKGKGKIVTRSWIEDCHSQKKRLPWRRYAIDSSELTKPESEDEIFDESLQPQDKTPIIPRQSSVESDDVEMYDNNNTASHVQCLSSGSDTEDEIQKVLANTSAVDEKATKAIEDVFEVSTEEEDYVSKRASKVPKTMDFFKDFKFLVTDQLSAVDKIKVERCIETFHGTLTTKLSKADYVIAKSPITGDAEFKGNVVTPLWILECNDTETLIPPKRYLVT